MASNNFDRLKICRRILFVSEKDPAKRITKPTKSWSSFEPEWVNILFRLCGHFYCGSLTKRKCSALRRLWPTELEPCASPCRVFSLGIRANLRKPSSRQKRDRRRSAGTWRSAGPKVWRIGRRSRWRRGFCWPAATWSTRHRCARSSSPPVPSRPNSFR